MISSEKITEIFLDSLFNEDEIIDGKPVKTPVWVNGIYNKFGFHPDRIKKHENDIKEIIENLNPTFKNGWSFCNLCVDKNNIQWTGQHSVCEQLMVLGMAIDKIEYCCSKDMWPIMPGGLPYIRIV